MAAGFAGGQTAAPPPEAPGGEDTGVGGGAVADSAPEGLGLGGDAGGVAGGEAGGVAGGSAGGDAGGVEEGGEAAGAGVGAFEIALPMSCSSWALLQACMFSTEPRELDIFNMICIYLS